MTSAAVHIAETFEFAIAAFKNERVKSATIVAAVAIGACILFLLDPARPGVYPACPFHVLTGLHCPGCGTLRASHQMLHLNVMAALRLNPLTVLSMPFLGYAFLSRAATWIRGRPLPKIFVPAGWIWALLVIIIAFWVLRNIPAYPFALLAPAG